MNQFRCDKAREIYETRFSVDIPQHVSVGAHKIMRVLVAARSLQDVGVLGPISRFRRTPDHLGLAVNGKWHVTFSWNDDFGAYEIALERH